MNPVGVYRHIDANGRCLYIGASTNPGARYDTHRSASSWAFEVVRIEIEWHPSREAAYAAERAAIFSERPPHNREWKIGKKKKWDPNFGQVFLFDWMRTHSVSIDEFASRLGEGKASARRLTTDNCHIRQPRANEICVATDGYVPVNAWGRWFSSFYGGPPIIALPSPEKAKRNFDEAVDRLIRWSRSLPPHAAARLAEAAP